MFRLPALLRMLILPIVILTIGCTPSTTTTPTAPPALPAAIGDSSPAVAQADASATGTQRAGTGAAKSVLAVETFLTDMAQNVAGSRLKVADLVPIGVDPHEFEPAPGDVARVAKSDVLIVNGSGFEPFLDKLMANAGGQHQIIDASDGLISRQAREGEVAEMSEGDLADGLCRVAADDTPKPVEAAATAVSAVELPAESGLFAVSLQKQADGTYGGFIKYKTDEPGAFWIAIGPGTIAVEQAKDVKTTLKAQSSFALKCGGLAKGSLVEMEKDSEYVLALTGFQEDKTSLIIGPAGGIHHQVGDSHFWLDPNNAVQYVQNIRDGLSKADPDGAETYTANATAYIVKLRELDSWIAEQVKQVPPERRLLVTNHESFGYYADRYGFKIIGTIVPSVSTGASPSAQQLARLITRIKATGAKAIFLETGSNTRMAQQVANETGIKVVTQLYTHSISEPGGPAPTYIDMMRFDTKTIVDALR